MNPRTPFSTPASVAAIDDRAGGVRVLELAPLQAFSWRPGQYARLVAMGHDPRPFSIAGLPDRTGHVRFHIRDNGVGLSRHLAQDLQLGDLITLEGPFGEMHADSARARPVLMVAGGTGIAPMLALAADIVKRGLTEEGITLIYGARSEDDIYCRRELDQLRATGEVTTHMAIGLETPDQTLRRLGLNLAHHVVYLSGPDPMLHSVRPVLLNHLADPARVYADTDFDDLQKEQS